MVGLPEAAFELFPDPPLEVSVLLQTYVGEAPAPAPKLTCRVGSALSQNEEEPFEVTTEVIAAVSLTVTLILELPEHPSELVEETEKLEEETGLTLMAEVVDPLLQTKPVPQFAEQLAVNVVLPP